MAEYKNVGPRSRANAEALLDAAKRLGFEVHEVRTVIGGYIVPAAVAEEFARMEAGETPSIEEGPADAEEVDEAGAKTPDDTWKNADIVAYAEENEIDLGGATKKADMLAAITADTKEE